MNKPLVTQTPILCSEHDPEKILKAMGKFFRTMRIVSLVLIILGVFFSFFGFSGYHQLGSYAKDSDEIMTMAMGSLGVIAVLAGIFFPVLMKSMVKNSAKNQELRVFSDHIEGKAIRISGSTQTLLDFYETFDKISSVSTTETNICINLKDGSSIRCLAANSQDIAALLRSKIA